MKKIKIIAILLAAITLISVLAACGQKTSLPQDSYVIAGSAQPTPETDWQEPSESDVQLNIPNDSTKEPSTANPTDEPLSTEPPKKPENTPSTPSGSNNNSNSKDNSGNTFGNISGNTSSNASSNASGNTSGSNDDLDDLNKNGRPEDKRGAGSIGGSTTQPSTPTPKPSNPTTPSKSAVDTDLVSMINKGSYISYPMPEKFVELEQEILKYLNNPEYDDVDKVELSYNKLYTTKEYLEFDTAWLCKYFHRLNLYTTRGFGYEYYDEELDMWVVEADPRELDESIPYICSISPKEYKKGLEYDYNSLPATEIPRIIQSLGINTSTTVKDAVTKINNYMCDRITYDHAYAAYNDLYSALKYGTTRCHGYATLFQELCLYCGIDVGYISSKKINHAWNSVTFSDGTTLYVDVTWNDNDNGTPSNKYLLITKAQMDKDHPLD